jgi:hypothetical protein
MCDLTGVWAADGGTISVGGVSSGANLRVWTLGRRATRRHLEFW